MKQWYKSKTIWTNAIVLAVGVLGIVSQSELVKENKDTILFITTLAIPILNLILRTMTSESLSLKKKHEVSTDG